MNRLPSRHRILCIAGLAVVVTLFTVWALSHLGGYEWDWDEGAYLMTARAVGGGLRLYRDVFSVAAPLFINSLNVAFAVAGQSAPAARGAVALYGGLAVLGVGLIAWELGGAAAGIGAAALLGLTPHFYMLSRTVIADVPSTALMCLALWAALRYERGGRRAWLAGAGVLLALGACLKLTALLAGPAIVFLILVHSRQDPTRQEGVKPAIIGLVVVGFAFALPLGVYALIYDPRLIYDQMIRQLLTQGETFKLDRLQNLRLMAAYLVQGHKASGIADRGLGVLALAGLTALAVRARKDVIFLGLWLLAVLAILINYAPLWVHLLSPLLYPLAAAAGVAVSELFRRVSCAGNLRTTPPAALGAIGLALAVAFYAYSLPGLVAQDQAFVRAPDWSEDLRAIEFLGQHTAFGDYVITDQPMIAFGANRNLPPNLADSSSVRILMGWLTAADLISDTERYAVSAVILWPRQGYIVRTLPRFVSWLDAHYELAWQGSKGRRIYVRTAVRPAR